MRAPGTLRKGIKPIVKTPKKAIQRMCVTELSFKDSLGILQTEIKKKKGLIRPRKWHGHQRET